VGGANLLMQNLPVAASGGHRGRFCSCGMP